jgi:archaellum component FlaC
MAGVSKKTKKKRVRAPSGAARAFAVVVEDVRSQFKVSGEALTAGFEGVDRRFEQVDRRFERVEQDIGFVKAAVIEHGKKLKDIRGALQRLDEKVDKKVDRAEVEAIVERTMARGAH